MQFPKQSDVFLRTIGQDAFEFNYTDMQTLYSIAHECPLAGGEAVYKARALFAMLNINEHYNDFDLCFAQGYNLRKAEAKNTAIIKAKLYPNPANDRATLEYYIPYEKATLYLYAATGSLQKKADLNTLQTQLNLDISQLAPAAYYYVIKANNAALATGKLIIVR